MPAPAVSAARVVVCNRKGVHVSLTGGNGQKSLERLKAMNYMSSQHPSRPACRNCIHGTMVFEGSRLIKRIKCGMLQAYTSPSGICDSFNKVGK